MLGENCIVGRGAYVGTGVQMGDNCKLQNYALVYEPAVLEDGVFVGPGRRASPTTTYPRAVSPDGTLKTGDDWEAVGRHLPHRRVDRRPRRVRGPGDHRPLGPRRRRLGGHQGRPRLRPRGRRPGPAHPLGRQGRASPSSRTTRGAWVCPQTGDQYIETRRHPDGGRAHA